MYVAFRLVSLILVLAGLILLGADLISTLGGGGGIVIRSLGRVWTAIDSGSIHGFKAWLQHAAPGGVTQGIESFLALPGWAVFGVVGVIVAFITGRRGPQEM